MNLLAEYLKNVGSEYKIVSSSGTVCISEKYDDILKCKKESSNVCHYNDDFYEMSHRQIQKDDETYDISVFSNVTKYVVELMKSKIDCLSKLPNREQLQKYLSSLKSESVLVMCDIDDFKKVNDTYGHQMGDSVIKLLGRLIKNITNKKEDFSGRYGGEEFLIIFNTNDVSKVKEKMDELSLNLKEYTNQLGITISSGVYCFDPNCETVSIAVKKADEALYYVKQHGKNACMAYDDIKEKTY